MYPEHHTLNTRNHHCQMEISGTGSYFVRWYHMQFLTFLLIWHDWLLCLQLTQDPRTEAQYRVIQHRRYHNGLKQSRNRAPRAGYPHFLLLMCRFQKWKGAPFVCYVLAYDSDNNHIYNAESTHDFFMLYLLINKDSLRSLWSSKYRLCLWSLKITGAIYA